MTTTANSKYLDMKNLISKALNHNQEVVALDWGDRNISYAELKSHVDHLSGVYLKAGAKSGTRIGVQTSTSEIAVLAMLSSISIDAVFIPFTKDVFSEKNISSTLLRYDLDIVVRGTSIQSSELTLSSSESISGTSLFFYSKPNLSVAHTEHSSQSGGILVPADNSDGLIGTIHHSDKIIDAVQTIQKAPVQLNEERWVITGSLQHAQFYIDTLTALSTQSSVFFNTKINQLDAESFGEFLELSEATVLSTNPSVLNSLGSEFNFVLEDIHGSLKIIFSYERPTALDACFETSPIPIITAGNYKELSTGSEIRITTPAISKEILSRWNSTEKDFFKNQSLIELIFQSLTKNATKQCVVFEEQHLSSSELLNTVEHFTHDLINSGVKPGDRVGVIMERSNELIVTLLAIMRLGASYVPLDPVNPPNRLQFMMEDGDLSLLVVNKQFQDLSSDTRIPFIVLDDISQINPLDSSNKIDLPPMPKDDVPAYIIYTSGSTGNPKGVVVGHRAIVNRLLWMRDEYGIDHDSVILQKTPYSFDVSVWELFLPLVCGAKLIFAKPEGHKDPLYLASLIQKENINVVHFVPSMLRAFMAAVDPSQCQSLTQVFCSGEALTSDLATNFLNTFSAKLHNLYGPTEAAVDVSFWECTLNNLEPSIPIGKPIANIQLYIVDEDLNPVGIHVEGELLIGGVGLAEGYFNREDLTNEKFVYLDHFGQRKQRLYRTGDLAKFDENGTIYYLGRLDFQIKIRGNRVELGEIESSIRSLDGIEDAVVVLQKGSADQDILVAYYQSQDQLNEDQLEKHLTTHVPSYMVPSIWQHITQFPLSPSGKLDRRALPSINLSFEHHKTVNHDCTELEALILELWCQILRNEKIGLDDNLFKLGCDSIMGLTFVSQLKSKGYVLELKDVFDAPTIREQAKLLEQSNDEKDVRSQDIIISEQDRLLTPPAVEDVYPLTKLQMGLLYQTELHKGTAMYHDIMCYMLEGPWNARLFQKALHQLVKHHSILRTTFDLTSYSEPMQLIQANYIPELCITDLTQLNHIDQNSYHQTFLKEEIERVYDWKTPPIHYFVQVLGHNKYRFILSLHDTLLDGWSVSLFVSQLFQCYHALLKNDASEFSLPSVMRYKSAVSQERIALSNPECKSFWLSELEEASPSLVGDYWFSNTGRSEKIIQQPVQINHQQSEQLKALAKHYGVSVKSVLLAAHLRVCALLQGTDEVICGLEHNARPELPGAEASLGLFLNTLPLRMRLKKETWASFIQRVHSKEINILPHRAYPYAQMLKDQNFEDLFDTVFNFVNFHVLRDALNEDFSPTQLADFENVLETEYALRAEFSINVQSNDIELLLHYRDSRFSLSTIEKISEYYKNTLQSITNDIDKPLNQSILFNEEEFESHKNGLGYHEYKFDQSLTFIDIYNQISEHNSDREAVIYRGQAWTYDQLSNKVNGFARLLRNNQCQSQSIVFILGERNSDYLAAMLGIFSIGAIYVPLDPRNPVSRLHSMLESCGGGILLYDAQFTSRAQELASLDNKNGSMTLLCLNNDIEDSSEEIDQRPSPADIAYIIFTSGSTGLPKGAMVNHLGMLNHLYSKVVDLDIQKSDRLLHTSPQSFDISIWQFMCTLMCGGTVVIGEDEHVVDPLRIAKLIQDFNITLVELVPALLQGVVNTHTHAENFSSLRFMLSTGEALKASLAYQWLERFPNVPLVNAFGPTECSDDVTHHTLTTLPQDTSSTVPIGTAIINTELYVLDPLGHPTPKGVPGELYISGICLGNGYIRNDEKTRAAFVSNVCGWDLDKKLYRSGDLVKLLPDDTLLFLDRIDSQVKIGGHRIELGELESQLSSHPTVENVIAIVTDDKRLVACISPANSEYPDVAQLESWAKLKLPHYMLPSSYHIIDELPVTINGKVDRKKISQLDFSVQDRVEREIRTPNSDIEKSLLSMWQVLFEGQTISIDDQFFEIGGESLLLLRLQSQINKRFPFEIDLVTLFERPTIELQAQLIESLSSQTIESSDKPEAGSQRKRKVKKRKRNTKTLDTV